MKKSSFLFIVVVGMAAWIAASPALAQTRLRGGNVNAGMGRGDLVELADWNANLLRVQIVPEIEAPIDPRANWAAYAAWYQSTVDHQVRNIRDVILPFAHSRGMKVLVDLHRPPGHYRTSSGDVIGGTWVFRGSHPSRALFLNTWDRITDQLSGRPGLWGYDLLNEPAGRTNRWRTLAQEAISRIRARDNNARIVVESRYGDPARLPELAPIRGHRIIYSVHFYRPMQFTHQLEPGRATIAYPGRIAGKNWNRDRVRRSLQRVRDWQNRHGARILMGEFAAARWAPGSLRYMRDVIEVCEGWGWDWAYHAFREANVWDVERGMDASSGRVAMSTKERMLRSYMARNR